MLQQTPDLAAKGSAKGSAKGPGKGIAPKIVPPAILSAERKAKDKGLAAPRLSSTGKDKHGGQVNNPGGSSGSASLQGEAKGPKEKAAKGVSPVSSQREGDSSLLKTPNSKANARKQEASNGVPPAPFQKAGSSPKGSTVKQARPPTATQHLEPKVNGQAASGNPKVGRGKQEDRLKQSGEPLLPR